MHIIQYYPWLNLHFGSLIPFPDVMYPRSFLRFTRYAYQYYQSVNLKFKSFIPMLVEVFDVVSRNKNLTVM